MSTSTAVVLVAAGSGSRLGAGTPKAMVPLAGAPLLTHALRTAIDPELADHVVVVLPASTPTPDSVTEAMRRGESAGVRVSQVHGGATRQESVAAGLAAAADARWVLVHDAARCLTSREQFRRVRDALAGGAVAVVPGLAPVDTIKRVDARGQVIGTLPRERLRAVQTPQGFDAALLRRAHAAADGGDAGDDAGMMERLGAPVTVVDGEERAFKITHPGDLLRAEALLSATGGPGEARALPTPVPRIGIGQDIHAFSDDPDRELWLAGLLWPGERGLKGHSDADAVAHAVCDALFSAAGIGDLGTHFGTDRPEFAGAAGAQLVGRACELVREAGFEIGNVAVQFIGNRPRFASRRQEADRTLTALVGAPVRVTATTSDGLGFEGAGEGISARAVALLLPRA